MLQPLDGIVRLAEVWMMWFLLTLGTALADPTGLVGESTFQLFRSSLDRARLPASLPLTQWVDLHTQLSQRASSAWLGAGAVGPIGPRSGLMGFGAVDPGGSRLRSDTTSVSHSRRVLWDASLAWGTRFGSWATGLRLTTEGSFVRSPASFDELGAVSGGPLDPLRPLWFRTHNRHTVEGTYGIRRTRDDGWFDTSLVVRWDRSLLRGRTDEDATGFVVEDGFVSIPGDGAFNRVPALSDNREVVRTHIEFENTRGRGRPRGHRVGGHVGITAGGVAQRESFSLVPPPPATGGVLQTRTWTEANELGAHVGGFGIGEFRWSGLELRVGGFLDIDLARFRGEGSDGALDGWSPRWDSGEGSLRIPMALMAEVHPKVAFIASAEARLLTSFLLWDNSRVSAYNNASSNFLGAGSGRLGVRWSPLERMTLTAITVMASPTTSGGNGGVTVPFGGGGAAGSTNPFGSPLISTPNFSLSLLASVVVHLGRVEGRGPLTDLAVPATQSHTIPEVR